MQEIVFVDFLPPLGVTEDVEDFPTEMRTKRVKARLLGCSTWNIQEDESGFILIFEDEVGLIHIQEINRFGTDTYYHHSVYKTLDDAKNNGYECEVNEVMNDALNK